MHTAPPYETKDGMALRGEENYIEKADGYSDTNSIASANEKAMTRHILLNLDFRYDI